MSKFSSFIIGLLLSIIIVLLIVIIIIFIGNTPDNTSNTQATNITNETISENNTINTINTSNSSNTTSSEVTETDELHGLVIGKLYSYYTEIYDETNTIVVSSTKYNIKLLDSKTAEVEYIYIPTGGLPPKLTGNYIITQDTLTIYTSYLDTYGSQTPQTVDHVHSFKILDNGSLQSTFDSSVILK